MVSDNQHPAAGGLVLPGELSAFQLAGIQPEQPSRIGASDELCDTEEVYERQAGQALAQREHVGLLFVSGVSETDRQIEYVARSYISGHA